MELYGGNAVHRVRRYNYLFLNLAEKTICDLPCIPARRPFGKKPDTGSFSTPILLVRNSDDVKECLAQCVAYVKRKSPVGHHHPLENISTGHRWDHIAMDILDVCDPTPEGHRYILVIADYFSKWTEAFPMKNKCADTVANILVEHIILRFGMPGV